MLTKLTLACLVALAQAKEHLTLAQLLADSTECCCDPCGECDEEEPEVPNVVVPPETEPDGPVIEIPIEYPVYPTTVETLPPETTLDDIFTSSEGKPVVLDFQYDACDPCQRIAPDFEALKDAHPEVTFRKVNIYDHKKMLEELDVTLIPTFKIFVNGKEETTIVGEDLSDLTRAINETIEAHGTTDEEAEEEAEAATNLAQTHSGRSRFIQNMLAAH